jgi:pyridoxal phosphate enzyme (YggS family)
MTTITANLHLVLENLSQAARAAGRNPDGIALVAISKTHPREAVLEALSAGQLIFGENRVQEAEEKFLPAIPGVELHLVGHLQNNKTKPAAALFDRIHSLDSFKTAERLERHLEENGRTMRALVQVNLGEEEQKSGVDEGALYELLLQCAGLSRLRVDGLMVLPPLFENPRRTRPWFSRLRELRDRLESRGLEGLTLPHLSMGMTNDYREAIAEGATFIRVGTAIFGARDYPA